MDRHTSASESSSSAGEDGLHAALSSGLAGVDNDAQWRRLLAFEENADATRFGRCSNLSDGEMVASDSDDTPVPDDGRGTRQSLDSPGLVSSRVTGVACPARTDATRPTSSAERAVAAVAGPSGAPVYADEGNAPPATSCVLLTSGRLPRDVVRELNAAWIAAGGDVPGDDVLVQLSMRYGMENAPRLRKFFADKARRSRRQGTQVSSRRKPATVDEQCLREIENFLFERVPPDALCPTIRSGLEHLLHFENVAGLCDVGHDLRQLFDTDIGYKALRNYQMAYWLALRTEMLALSSMTTAAAQNCAVNIEFRVRFSFPDSHARIGLEPICAQFAAQRRAPSVAAQQHVRSSQDSLATAVGRRQMPAVNSRVRDFFQARRARSNVVS